MVINKYGGVTLYIWPHCVCDNNAKAHVLFSCTFMIPGNLISQELPGHFGITPYADLGRLREHSRLCSPCM